MHAMNQAPISPFIYSPGVEQREEDEAETPES
jgi:hypothetical protein